MQNKTLYIFFLFESEMFSKKQMISFRRHVLQCKNCIKNFFDHLRSVWLIYFHCICYVYSFITNIDSICLSISSDIDIFTQYVILIAYTNCNFRNEWKNVTAEIWTKALSVSCQLCTNWANNHKSWGQNSLWEPGSLNQGLLFKILPGHLSPNRKTATGMMYIPIRKIVLKLIKCW